MKAVLTLIFGVVIGGLIMWAWERHELGLALAAQSAEASYACHKSINRPFLRPMIPTISPQPVMNYDPDAKWPN